MQQGCLFSPLLLNIILKVLVIAIREEKEIKSIGEEEIDLFLFADDTVVYVNYSKKYFKSEVKHCLEPVKELSKVTMYMVNTQKSITYLQIDHDYMNT